MIKHRARMRALAGLLGVLLFAAGCGGDDSGNEAGGTTDGAVTTTAAEGTPRRGGIVTIGQFSAAPGLDPAKSPTTGATGAMPLAAIYDTLMRFDPETGEYVGRTAESLEPNEDATVWTLKLKPGITFQDGNPYDAAAVKWSLEREMAEGNASVKGTLNSLIESLEVVDDVTLTLNLKRGWFGLPYLFTGVPGMVYSKAAVEAAGEDFNVRPTGAGAGPFRVKEYRPGEVIELERNPDYHGGDVYLDGLRFVLLPGGAATYESLKAGQLQGGFFIDPTVLRQATDEGFGSLSALALANTSLNMNPGTNPECSGSELVDACRAGTPGVPPTADIRVRQAIAAAVDGEIVNERAYNGDVDPDSAPFAQMTGGPDTPGPAFDLEKAKRLVEEAKADGWDGKVRVMANNSPAGRDFLQSITVQLELAGMDPIAESTLDQAGVIDRVLVKKDWDVVQWGYGFLEDTDSIYPQLTVSFNSATRLYNWGTPEMDAAIDALRVASTADAKREALAQIAEEWNASMPARVVTAVPQAFIFSPKLHGVVRSGYVIPLFDGAWLEE